MRATSLRVSRSPSTPSALTGMPIVPLLDVISYFSNLALSHRPDLLTTIHRQSAQPHSLARVWHIPGSRKGLAHADPAQTLKPSHHPVAIAPCSTIAPSLLVLPPAASESV